MEPHLQETIYTPEPELRRPARLLTSMMKDIIQSRELAWRLFIRNISARYRQTIIGYAWAILPPLLTSLTWIFLNAQNIMSIKRTDVPYALYVLVGTVLWQVFADSIHTPIRVVKESASMIAKINFPRESLILAAILEILFNFSIQLCLLAGVLIYFGVPLSFTTLLVLPGIVGLIMAGVMVGIILTPFSILYGDIQNGLPLILQPLFYLTPIVYAPPDHGIGALISLYNPISPLIKFPREIIISGQVTDLQPFLIVSCVTFFMLFSGWILYRISMPHLIERIAA